MTDKEKLTELLESVDYHQRLYPDTYVDHLIANGVAVREKGEWVETEEGTICSECHEHPFEDGYYAIANYNGDFCPNCGAKMDDHT